MPSPSLPIALLLAVGELAAASPDSVRVRPRLPLAPSGAATQLPQPGCDSLERILAEHAVRFAQSDSQAFRMSDTLRGLRQSLVRADSLHRLDSALSSNRADSLALVRRFDSLTIQIDTTTYSDTSIASSARRFRQSLLAVAVQKDLSVRRVPPIPGLRNCIQLRSSLVRRNDTTWVRLVRLGRSDSTIVFDSARTIDDSARARLERDAIRSLFGNQTLAPEPKPPFHWTVRLGILCAVALTSILVSVSLL